mmetsp:Transcript_1869/g.5485  ORF Transcript_1869/g.5485 Transcript_1869/m.5485 type:complete len:364 (-) Transcript_1869:150-1241(-)|eukprot:CAMPEP_0179342792 /NCGR_PEP_ID=MMETSP0797-20121207/70610_1 /TAXON_ID=47934 /ORGANISM="Dinophysis acuminata, Strain DAEP01" /LENGTH=363 /DNA_ID=CAMNT_0021057059 /DNA_START=44 /DNA_END=1135 /DNA_ORIENTATION=+
MVAAAKLVLDDGEVLELPDQEQQEHTDDENISIGSGLDVPLSQLVLETYFGSKRRPYDRKRQDELARPRRVATPPSRANGSTSLEQPSTRTASVDKVSREKVDSVVARLAQPKKTMLSARSPGDSIVAMVQDQERARRPQLDVDAIVLRLATPRRVRRDMETPGERILSMYNTPAHPRPVNLDRIAAMAKPTRRGGSSAAWLRPSTTWAGSRPVNYSQDYEANWQSVGDHPGSAASASARNGAPARGGQSDSNNSEGYLEDHPEGRADTSRAHCRHGSSDGCSSNPDASDHSGAVGSFDADAGREARSSGVAATPRQRRTSGDSQKSMSTTWPKASPGRGNTFTGTASIPHSEGWRGGVDRYV